VWWHACVAAKTVQRMWRQWRHRPPVSVAALAKQAASAEDDSDRPTVQEAEEEDDLVDAPRNRALDSLFARQFPQFSAVLESHREGAEHIKRRARVPLRWSPNESKGWTTWECG
jgi:hypothetical protein